MEAEDQSASVSLLTSAVADLDLAAASLRVPACLEEGRQPPAASHGEPRLARAFAGWDANGNELFREFWPVPAGAARPLARRPVQALREGMARLSPGGGDPRGLGLGALQDQFATSPIGPVQRPPHLPH